LGEGARRAIFTDILHFRARVPVIPAARAANGQRPDPSTGVPPIPLVRPTVPGSSDFTSKHSGPAASPLSERRSAFHAHAAALTEGHLPHDAVRLASTRARRATAARDNRSPGTASPVPKYISSGVCPRNAECGSTRLCSWTENARGRRTVVTASSGWRKER